MEERYRTAPRWEVRGGGRRKAGREDLTLRLLFRVYGPGLCPVKEEGWMGPCTCPPVCHSSLCCGPASRQASENMVGRASPAERADSSRTAPASPVHSTPHSSRSPHQLLSWSCMNSRQLLPRPGHPGWAPPGKGLSGLGTAASPSTWECLARETPRGGSINLSLSWVPARSTQD